MKRSRKKAVLTQAVGGYINTAISITQGLLLLPIYFKFIDISTYGYWVTIGSIIALLSIVNFGVENLTMQRISSAYAKKDYKSVCDYFINSLVLYSVISLIFIIIASSSISYLETKVDISQALKDELIVAYYISIITMVLSFFTNALKGFSVSLLNPLFGVYSTIVARIISIIVTIVLLYKNIGLLSIPIGLLVSELIIVISNAIFVFVQYKKFNISSKINLLILKEYICFSPHLFGLILGNMMTNKSHPLIITTLLGSEMTTLYTVTRKVIDIILQSVNIINSSLIAPISHMIGEGDTIKIAKIVLKIMNLSFMVTLLLIGGYISSNYIFVSLWLGIDKVLDNEIIMMIGLGALVLSMTRVLRSILIGFDEFKFTSLVVFIEGILFILSSLLLIKLFGIIGIAYGLLISSSFVLVFMYNKILDKLNKSIEIKSIFINSIFMLTSIIFIYYIQTYLYSDISWFIFILQVSITVLGIVMIELMFNYKYFKEIYKGNK